MSKENVKHFYEALAKDKAFQAKAIAVGKKYAGQKLDEAQTNAIYQQEMLPLAKKAGYDFTLAELQAYAAETEKSGLREVSEEELATVAGGTICACAQWGTGNVLFPDGTGGGCSCFVGGGGNLDGGKVDCVCVFAGGGG